MLVAEEKEIIKIYSDLFSNIKDKFDLIIFERIKEQTLIEHINRVGIKLYEREIKT